MYKMTDDEFEGAIADALDSIPEDLALSMDNVVVLVADEPEDWQMGFASDYEDDVDFEDDLDPAAANGAVVKGSELLGLYDGIALTERDGSYGAVDDIPDTITIFKGPHERLEGGRDEILEEVRRTVIHEVGHYFGMSERQIDEMGYA